MKNIKNIKNIKKGLYVILGIVIIFTFIGLNLMPKTDSSNDVYKIVTDVSFVDADKNIADEIVFEYNIKTKKTYEYNLAIANKGKVELSFSNEELTEYILFEVLDEKNKIVYSKELKDQCNEEFNLDNGEYKVKIKFLGGSGKGVIKWEVI